MIVNLTEGRRWRTLSWVFFTLALYWAVFTDDDLSAWALAILSSIFWVSARLVDLLIQIRVTQLTEPRRQL